MTSRTKLWALSAGALALSLALAGCGGGGSSGSPQATNSGGGAPPPAPPAPMQVSLASVTTDGAGYTAPMATGDDPIEIDAGMSADSGSVTFTCAAGGDDCTVMVAADGSVTSTGGTVTAMNSTAYAAALAIEAARVAALGKETALRNKVAALQPIAGADDAAGSALMMAKKYAAMIGTEASDGDSLVAKNNAAMVLKARSDLMAAIDAAKMARNEAMTAKDGLDAGQTDLIGTLDAAITLANTAIAAAEEILDATGDGLWRHRLSKGHRRRRGQPENRRRQGHGSGRGGRHGPRAHRARGRLTAADGAGLRVSHISAAPAAALTQITVGTGSPADVRVATNPVAKANKYEAPVSHDPESMTWAMIVGEDNVMDKEIADGTTGNFKTVKAASVSGMTLGFTGTFDAGNVAEGAQTDTGLTYKGIPGGVFCGGSDCMVEAVVDDPTTTGVDESTTQRKLVGSWYFTPANVRAFWMKAAGATVYTEDTMFATYGHWLVVDDSDDASTTGVDEEGQVYVLTYAYGPSAASIGGWAEDASGTPGSEQATYEGMAVGRSVHKVSNEDVSIIETHSGRFTATVVLTAKFGDGASGEDSAPMLGGTVSDFRSDNPNAVDSDWTVTLEETEVAAGLVTAGTTTATGQDGTWSATSYGGADAVAGTSPVVRPEGIYGGFNAHFTDGHVAGAYATRND